MGEPDGPLGIPADLPEPIRIPEPPGGFPPSRKPKKSQQNGQPRRGSLAARLPVASLIRAGVVITGAAIVVLVIVIVIIAVGQH